jgi:hypothetical protein
MPEWKTRLVVSYTDSTGTHLISPIDSFTPTFQMNAEVLHSIEATHIGYVHTPSSITFQLTVRAIGDAAAGLTSLAMTRTPFDLLLQESDSGHDWSQKRIVLTRCLITSAGPSAATISGAPSATFSGVSLGAMAEPKSGQATAVP